MKQTTLRKIADRKFFKLKKDKRSPYYTMDRKKKGKAIFTSCDSDRTFERPLTTICYI